MPTLQVRDIPQDLYDDLKARAAAEKRSITQETIVLLTTALRASEPGVRDAQPQLQPYEEPPAPGTRKVSYEDALAGWQYPSDETREERIARRKKLFEEIAKLPKIDLPEGFPTPEEIVREMRDSR